MPGSDGAGTVIAVGKNVKRFKEGDKVITLFNAGHIGGSLDQFSMKTGLGGAIDGTLRQYGAFSDEGLVHMPSNLNFVEAATLTCAGLTAWNALYGLKPLKAGDWVLTQGTGGVSLFAIQVRVQLATRTSQGAFPTNGTPLSQFAKAAGANVIATTSSSDKADYLKKTLGADHVINYKDTPEWGAAARELTPGKRGVDHVVEVAGPASMKQSLATIAIDGVISIIGFVGGGAKDKEPSFMEALSNICTVRGVLVGSRVQMEDMCRAVQSNERLRPVVDKKVFSLEGVKQAYEHQWAAKHIGKVCIKIE